MIDIVVLSHTSPLSIVAINRSSFIFIPSHIINNSRAVWECPKGPKAPVPCERCTKEKKIIYRNMFPVTLFVRSEILSRGTFFTCIQIFKADMLIIQISPVAIFIQISPKYNLVHVRNKVYHADKTSLGRNK
jgi:hypothetical protein